MRKIPIIGFLLIGNFFILLLIFGPIQNDFKYNKQLQTAFDDNQLMISSPYAGYNSNYNFTTKQLDSLKQLDHIQSVEPVIYNAHPKSITLKDTYLNIQRMNNQLSILDDVDYIYGTKPLVANDVVVADDIVSLLGYNAQDIIGSKIPDTNYTISGVYKSPIKRNLYTVQDETLLTLYTKGTATDQQLWNRQVENFKKEMKKNPDEYKAYKDYDNIYKSPSSDYLLITIDDVKNTDTVVSEIKDWAANDDSKQNPLVQYGNDINILTPNKLSIGEFTRFVNSTSRAYPDMPIYIIFGILANLAVIYQASKQRKIIKK